jgi:hypothetical protein
MLDHGLLTDLVISHLEDRIAALVSSSALPLVGDGVAPDGGGWLEGQPGQGVFRPYVVVASGGASPRYQNLSTFEPNWGANYSLRSFGGSRKQCDWMATISRQAIEGMVPTAVGTWQVIGLEWGSLGPVSRVDATAPPFWQVFDSVSLVLSS